MADAPAPAAIGHTVPTARGGAQAPYVDVVVDVPTDKPGDTFTYAAPPELHLEPGHHVRIPFGRRTAGGIVVAHRWHTELGYTRPVAGVVHAEPVLSAVQLDLARWISDYYAAPAYEALAPMLPPGHRARSRAIIRLRDDADAPPDSLTPGAARLFAYLKGHLQPQYAAALTRRLGPWVPNALLALDRADVLRERWTAEPGHASRPTRPMVQRVRLAVDRELAVAWAREREGRAPRQAALALALAEAPGPYAATEARRVFGAGAVTALVGHEIAEVVQLTDEPAPPAPAEAALLPTPEQADALAAVRAALDAPGPGRSFLLHGVTGSGKTEVYLQAIAHALGLGKRAIVLVPELSLTPQTMARFEARFPGDVAALHSGLTPAQQWEAWWRVRRGEARVVVGSRGAIFAPQPDLGLIVVDEEHEWTYKQQDAMPRYHAREVALKLAELSGCVVLMGSATPDLVTEYAAASGRHTRLALPQRIESSGAPAPLASVDIVDMRDELRRGNRGVFSGNLKDALIETFEAGQQTILFLNRRGSASVVECRACGHAIRCHRCGTAYTYHAPAGHAPASLVCHQCNHRRGAPKTCPHCHSTQIRYLGLGTQRLVEEVEALLPGVRVLRWDRDSASSARAHTDLLTRFASGEVDVMVGTQMVAKGLHLPGVTLVGVVLADLGLHVADFRAPERTFQVLTQVAGRSGRGEQPGRVVLQTYMPEHYAIQAAARQDYDGFYEQELANRQALGNPPYSRLITLAFAHTNESTARREAQRTATLLRREARAWDMTSVRVVGPAPAYPPRLRGAWRWHLTLRGPDPRQLLDKVTLPPAWAVDVDPA